MEQIYRICTAILAVLCMGHSLQSLFPRQLKRWKRLAMLYLLYMVFTMPSWVGDENPILLFPVFFLGFWVFLAGDTLAKLVSSAIFYTLFISLNALFDSLFRDEVMLVVALVVKMLLWCLLAWFLPRIVPAGGLRLSKKLWLLLGGLTLAPLVSTLSFSIWGYHWVEQDNFLLYTSTLERLGFTILPFALFSALALLLASVVLSRHEALEQENKLSALREVYYNGLKQEQTQLRTLRHDLRNHVTVLQGLVEQGKQAELSRYLADLSDSPALDAGKRFAQNETANVVLCSKAVQMAQLGLVPQFEVSLPETLSLPATELCALLGNALDNAIEGTAGAENQTVALRARLEKGMFMLQVKNEIGGALKSDLSTTKADVSQHGYGLAGMREIAVRHGGSLEAGASNGYFELVVCFPCQEAAN